MPPATTSGIQQVFENTTQPLIPSGGVQSKQDSINVSFLQTQPPVAPINTIEAANSSPVYVTTGSDVVSSTKWINSSTADNLSSASGLSSHPSSPSAQLSPSPPQSPNSSHASSGGSPQLVISESKPESPSVPSSQVSPNSDSETINGTKFQYNHKNVSNTSIVPNILKSTPASGSKELRQDAIGGNGHKVVIQ